MDCNNVSLMRIETKDVIITPTIDIYFVIQINYNIVLQIIKHVVFIISALKVEDFAKFLQKQTANKEKKMKSKFVYVSYIKTTPEKLWQALITPEFIKQYWASMDVKCDWKVGSPWTLSFPDGRVADAGEIVEFIPTKRIVIKWRNEWKPEMKEEGFTRCTFDLEQTDGAAKLTLTHEMDILNSKFIEAVSSGWPMILSNLKSLLETGNVVLKELKCGKA